MKKILFLFACIIFFSKAFAALPPAPPTSVSGSQQNLDNIINVSWTAPIPAPDGYKIFYKNLASPSTVYSQIVGVVTSANITGLSYNQTYQIYLQSFKIGPAPTDTTYSISSGTADVLVVGLVAPIVSTNIANNTYNSIGVIIDESNPYETGYQIEVSENGNISTKDIGAVNSNFFVPMDGLKAKTTYSIRARAKRNAQFGPWSTSIFATTKVAPPPAPSISSDRNCPENVHILWTISTRPEDIDEFIVQKSFDNSVFSEIARYGSGQRDHYDLTSLPGRTQFYRVIAVNSTGITHSANLSVTAKDYVNPNPAISPISDQTNKSNHHLTIRWTNGTEDTECRTNIRTENIINVKINGGNFVQYARVPGYQSNIRIDNLLPKSIVEVGIIAVSDKGKISSTTVVRDTTAGPPYAPSNMIGILYYDALGNPAYDLSWKDNSRDEDYFIIERGFDNKNFQQLGKIKNDITKFKDLNIEEGVIYYYRVKAGSNTEGESSYSDIIGPFLTQYSKAPNAPYGLKAKQTGNKVALTWYDDSNKEENYIIEKSQDGGTTFSLVATLVKNITTYTDENVTGGKTYKYRVKAVNSVGTSAYSGLETITISGSGSIEGTLSLNVFPNPAFDYINIENSNLNSEKEYSIKIYDRNNRQVLSKSFKINGDNSFELPINNLGQGLYNMVITSDGNSLTKKIFKY